MSNETLQTLSHILVATGIIFTALGGYGAYYFGKRIETQKEALQIQKGQEQEARRAYSGHLKSQLLLDLDQNIYPKFEFGDSGSTITFTSEPGTPLFNIAGDNDLTILIEDGQMKVSTMIRDKNGHVIAEIQKNEWRVNPNNTWDRNYSKDALEVKDPSGDIVLQVRLIEDRIQFQGKMYDATGRGISFGKMLGPEGWGGVIEITGPDHPQLQLEIEPLFQYPSDLHLGEFAVFKPRI